MAPRPSDIHTDFQKLTDEWCQSRYANGIGDDLESTREELQAFIDELDQEELYTAIQSAMDRLDTIYVQRLPHN